MSQKQISVLVNSTKEKVLRCANLSYWNEFGRSEECFEIQETKNIRLFARSDWSDTKDVAINVCLCSAKERY